MNKLSKYAIIWGIIGIVFLVLANLAAIQHGLEPLSIIRKSLFYVFASFMLVSFIASIVLGILGVRKKEGSRVLRYIGLLFVPIFIIGFVGFIFFMAWAAFIA